MGNKPTRQEQSAEIDAVKFVSTYEASIANSEANKQARMEDFVTREIFDVSAESVVPVYEQLSGSVIDARYLAAEGIARAFSLDPKRMGRIWNNLLNDGDAEIAQAAYYTFDQMCSDAEASGGAGLDLTSVYE